MREGLVRLGAIRLRGLSSGLRVGAWGWGGGKGRVLALCCTQAQLLGAERLLRLFGFKDTASCSGLWEPTSV